MARKQVSRKRRVKRILKMVWLTSVQHSTIQS